jgi:hypothetical protein
MPSTKATSRRADRAAGKALPAVSAESLPSLASRFTLAQQVRSWTDSMVRMAGPATDIAVVAAGARTDDPKQCAAIDKAGAVLRRMRESAGMTVQDVAAALDLSAPDLLQSAESGAAALPVEMILRLAAVLGRASPLQCHPARDALRAARGGATDAVPRCT